MPSYIRVHDKAIPSVRKKLGRLPLEALESKISEGYSHLNENNCSHVNKCPYVNDPKNLKMCFSSNLEYLNCKKRSEMDDCPDIFDEIEEPIDGHRRYPKDLYKDESVDALSNSGIIDISKVSETSGLSLCSDSSIKKRKKRAD